MRPQRFTPRGTKRDGLHGARQVREKARPFPPTSSPCRAAPYGRICIRIEGCTLCLACVGVCPTRSGDNPDRPEVSFTEAASAVRNLRGDLPESVISSKAVLRLHTRRASRRWCSRAKSRSTGAAAVSRVRHAPIEAVMKRP